MNIIHVNGLASFARRYKASQIEETAGGTGVIGTIMDKISGCRVAFDVAGKSTPCIIHICLDHEIIDTDDTESRHDEESRLLSCVRENLAGIYQEVESVDFG